jgi:uncharacterized protein
MQSHWLTAPTTYDGSQLRSHWNSKQSSLQGDTIVGMIGAAQVDATHMVDLEDLAAQAWITSECMLHFIIECFDRPLREMILIQRLFVSLVADALMRHTGRTSIQRRGNDLFDEEKKLSVSIATSSPVSSLIHYGINIVSDGTPVPTKGLRDYDIDPEPFARELMQKLCKEIEGADHASTKVRPVP